MKFVIIGDGYIGNYLYKNLPNAELFPKKIETIETIKLLMEARPDSILINCAGKTGRPNVDWCEEHKEETVFGNVTLPLLIAEAMEELGGRYWIHIGSGCVYNGYLKEWTEDDKPNFYGSFYAKSKIYSQKLLERYNNVLCLRIRMPLDEDMNKRSYISKIVYYAKEGLPLFDMRNSMTVLQDLAMVIKHVVPDRVVGTLNVINEGQMNITEILNLYKEHCQSDLQFIIKDMNFVLSTLKAERSNCILSTGKLRMLGIQMPNLEDRITEILTRKGKVKSK